LKHKLQIYTALKLLVEESGSDAVAALWRDQTKPNRLNPKDSGEAH